MLASPASSTTYSYEITGVVTQLFDSPFPEAVAQGDTLHARFDFDPLAPERFPGSAYTTDYPLLGWELDLGALHARSAPVLVFSQDYISKGGERGAFNDLYQLHGQQDHRGGAYYDTAQVLISLSDQNERNGDFDRSLILESSDFPHYEDQIFLIYHYGYFDGVTFSSSTRSPAVLRGA